jgi:uncharacterized membrane protein (DUF441 family)
MKKTLWFIVLVFSSMFLKAQTDIIYPADRSAIIFDCKINEVKNGNMVYYTKNQLADSIKAIAITKNGNYIDLSNYINSLDKTKPMNPTDDKELILQGYDFEYYHKQYLKSKGHTLGGVIFTVIGAAMVVTGQSILNDGKTETEKGGRIALNVGVVIVNIGVPLIISGAIKASNNKRAMDRVKPSVALSFGPTKDGVGLKLALK